MKCKVKGIRVINTILCDVLGFSLLVCSGFAWGEIIVDNKFNGHERPVLPNKGTMTIDQSLGKISDKNLFHSFKVFDINKGQTAIFTDSGNHAINNVISRVTGDGISHIDGTLVVDKGTMPNADFYFINPNGVVFGEGSYVNVPGAFHVSTANSLKFDDGGLYSATLPDTASSFTATAPKSFGFLGGKHQKQAVLSIKGSNSDSNRVTQWVFEEGQKVSFTAGTIKIDGEGNGEVLPVLIQSPSGVIRLLAIGDAQEKININDIFNAKNLRNFHYNGNVQIKGSAISTAEGSNGSGLIIVQAGNLTLSNNSQLVSWHNDTNDVANQAGVFIGATNTLKIIENGKIEASNRGNSKGGQVIVKTGELYIDGEGSGIFNNAGCDHGLCDNTGSAGAITVNVDGTIKINSSGVISSDSFSNANGNAGAINITAKNITIDGNHKAIKAGIVSDQCSSSNDACIGSHGKAGDIILATQKLMVVNGGRISSSTENKGAAGNITVNADNLTLQDATIKTEVNNTGATTNGGFINLKGGIIRLNDSQITTSVKGSGQGGDIAISGNNKINADGLILNGGFIQANGNKGGNITNKVNTLLASHGQLQVGGDKHEFQPGFNAIQAASKNGESGTIKSTAPELNITGAMLNLKSGFLQRPDLNASPCSSGKGSSLVQVGYGGLPRKPSDAVYVPEHPNTTSTISKANITTIGKHNLMCKPSGE
ncbi:hypothetical protein CRENPOLYSF2_1870002 [Crenothrix polyspora]|uniref:Filamentous haemagglutinin FhaB/tRNA nuclease CdiA-like TPS domain-containing protein n=1 Tax=Crenothrix polyspora TaxID=360316 RepID=A0A1R4H3I2_9GAMM|nr:filamentous hemagglutinin N-terminal domain-containing protein [Crenothrix polyspora]SJM90815.1 hypothetical protein CRENPOLYSF2_1870002 [Crenothrix polyspora]